jgi:hypothetical protein
MTHEATRTSEEIESQRKASSDPANAAFARDATSPLPTYGPKSLAQTAFFGRGNGALRARAIKGTQAQFGNRATARFVQRQTANSPMPVQREGEEDEFRISALPPEVHVPMGPVALDADTGNAQLGYNRGLLGVNAGYEYGGDIFAGGRYGGLSGRLGFNPGDERFTLSGSYGGFRGSAYAGLDGSAGLSLGYGSSLLPMPADLSRSIYSGEAGMRNMITGLPGIVNDPIGAIGRHGDDISAIGGAGSTLSGLAGQPSLPFGVGARLSYDPTLGVTAWGGIQGSF